MPKINAFFDQYQSLSNDELRNKTVEFKQRIKEHLTEIDNQISAKKAEADQLESIDIAGRDQIYQQVDAMGKDRDKKIEEIFLSYYPKHLRGKRNRPSF